MSLLDKYKKTSPALRASFWFAFCSFLQKGIAFITTPIFTRLMSREQYGEYTIYISWYSIISIFATLNLTLGVYNNAMTKYESDRSRVTSSMLGLTTVFSIITILFFAGDLIFWSDLIELSPYIIAILLMEVLFDAAFGFWAAQHRYDYNYKPLVVVTLVVSFLTSLLGVLGVITTPYKAEARIISYAMVKIVVGLIIFIIIMRKGKCFYHKEYWTYALRFNLPLIPHYLSSTILSQSDRIMIEKMTGKGDAAMYGVAYSVSMIMLIITTAINNSFIPYSYKELKEQRFDGIRSNSIVLLLFVAFISLFAIVLGPEMILLMGGEKYYPAIWVIPPVASSVYFMFLYPLFGNIEFFYEKNGFVAVGSCVAAVANVVLNFIFIDKFGYYAAGYTTLFCYIVYAIAHYFFCKKTLKGKALSINNIYNIKMILLISFGLLVITGVTTFLYKYVIVRYALLSIFILLLIIYRKKILRIYKEIRRK